MDPRGKKWMTLKLQFNFLEKSQVAVMKTWVPIETSTNFCGHAISAIHAIDADWAIWVRKRILVPTSFAEKAIKDN